MKIGLIGRCDDRGIGNQTWEFFRHMPVERTLAVLMDQPGWPEDTGRFGREAIFVDSNLSTKRDERTLDERKVRQFLDGLDVVFAVETVYDWSLIDIADELGVKVVVQGNPEFFAHHEYGFQPPHRWVWPTTWMLDRLGEHLPADQLGVLPVPTVVAPTWCTAAAPGADGPLNVLHVVGKQAIGDRAGTLEFLEAIPSIRERVHVTITTQDGSAPGNIRHGSNVTVDVVNSSRASRWDLYSEQHVLVSPRKYGGLHLPALEAMATGMTVVMPDCSPNEMWPGQRIKARKGRMVRTPLGSIQTAAVHPLDIATTIDRLAKDRAALADDMEVSALWAERNSWDELAPRLYMPLFEELCS